MYVDVRVLSSIFGHHSKTKLDHYLLWSRAAAVRVVTRRYSHRNTYNKHVGVDNIGSK